MLDDDECGVVGGMRIGRGTEVLRENLPLCPPQIPHGLTWPRNQATVVESQQLTT
jgi:hypothetical protein